MTFHPLGEIIKDDLGAEAHRLLRSKCDMGGYKAVGSVQDGGGGVQRRLLIKDINGSTGDHTVFKRYDEVFFHDNRAACNIDQKSRGFIIASFSALIMPRVESFSGQCRTTMSERRSNSS